MKWPCSDNPPIAEAVSTNNGRSRRPLVWFCIFYGLMSVLLSHWFLVPGAYWSGDSALKMLQAEVFRQSAFQQAALPKPGESWDPEGRYFAYRRPFAVEIEARHYCVYPVVFTLFLAALQTVLGSWAAALPAALGGALTVYFTGRLAEKVLPGRWMGMKAALLAGFASPVFVYSSQVWEHTPAAACMAAGVGVLAGGWGRRSGRRWVIAGALLAAGVWFRTEGIVFFASVVGAAFFWSGPGWKQRFFHCLLLVAGFVLGMIPLLLLNSLIYGLPLGPHAEMILSTYSRIQTRGVEMYFGDVSTRRWHRLSLLDWLFIRSTNYLGFSLKTAIPFLLYLAGCFLGPLRKNRLWNELLLGLCVAVMLRVAWEILSSGGRTVSGLWIVMPYSILVFRLLPQLLTGTTFKRWFGGRLEGKTPQKPDTPIPFLLGTILLFFVLCGFGNIGSKGGLQWGPRYLIPAFPVLVVLFLAAIRGIPGGRKGPAAVLAWTLVAFAVFFQGVGLVWIRQDEQQTKYLLDAIRRENPAAVVSYRRSWLAQMCAPLYLETPVFQVRSREELAAFLDADKPMTNRDLLILTYREEPEPTDRFECVQPVELYRLCRPKVE